jgi:hypothetical protein
MAYLVTTLKRLPVFADLEVWAGDSIAVTLRVTVGGSPADLTQGELTGGLDDGSEFTIDTSHGADGTAVLSLPEGAKPSATRWDVQWTGGPFGRLTVAAGAVRVREDVTP